MTASRKAARPTRAERRIIGRALRALRLADRLPSRPGRSTRRTVAALLDLVHLAAVESPAAGVGAVALRSAGEAGRLLRALGHGGPASRATVERVSALALLIRFAVAPPAPTAG